VRKQPLAIGINDPTPPNREKEIEMKKIIAGVFAMTLVLASFALHAADTKKSGNTMLVPVADVKWSDVPNFPGVKMAVLDGDPAKGAHHSMLKFAGGFAAPLHHHSSDHSGTVVAGTLVLTIDGKENKLPPGSFFSFKGKGKHMTKCEAGADCILSMDVRGKWDVVAEDTKPAAKKK
jgi:quercetin dioxygenase-like cupin family protein